MNDDIQSTADSVEKSSKNDAHSEKGTTELLFGAGVGTYGTAAFLTTGFACPACMILTPALIGVGAYKRIKFNKSKQNCELQSESSNILGLKQS